MSPENMLRLNNSDNRHYRKINIVFKRIISDLFRNLQKYYKSRKQDILFNSQ